MALKHVAIIMDGNGRWAQARNKNRYWGHVRGAEVTQKIVEHCAGIKNITHLTLYAFSTENWSRPPEEVSFLFKLMERQIIKKRDYLIENKVRLRIIGDLSKLPERTQKNIMALVNDTKNNEGLNLTLALNYGGKQEIVNLVNHYYSSDFTEPLTVEKIDEVLLQKGVGFPDLIIRTSGEKRLSNFMLWQSAYAELYFTKTLWPDFTPKDFDLALADYACRKRRFGGIDLESSNEAAL